MCRSQFYPLWFWLYFGHVSNCKYMFINCSARPWHGQQQGQSVVSAEEAPESSNRFQWSPAGPARAQLRTAEVLERARPNGAGRFPQPHRHTGQNLVPEQEVSTATLVCLWFNYTNYNQFKRTISILIVGYRLNGWMQWAHAKIEYVCARAPVSSSPTDRMISSCQTNSLVTYAARSLRSNLFLKTCTHCINSFTIKEKIITEKNPS